MNNFKGLLPKKKIFIVENFVGDDIYKGVNERNKKTDILRIVYLSNLMEQKGILDLLDALIFLDKKGDAQFHKGVMLIEAISQDYQKRHIGYDQIEQCGDKSRPHRLELYPIVS